MSVRIVEDQVCKREADIILTVTQLRWGQTKSILTLVTMENARGNSPYWSGDWGYFYPTSSSLKLAGPHLSVDISEEGTCCWLCPPSGEYISLLKTSVAHSFTSKVSWGIYNLVSSSQRPQKLKKPSFKYYFQIDHVDQHSFSTCTHLHGKSRDFAIL